MAYGLERKYFSAKCEFFFARTKSRMRQSGRNTQTAAEWLASVSFVGSICKHASPAACGLALSPLPPSAAPSQRCAPVGHFSRLCETLTHTQTLATWQVPRKTGPPAAHLAIRRPLEVPCRVGLTGGRARHHCRQRPLLAAQNGETFSFCQLRVRAAWHSGTNFSVALRKAASSLRSTTWHKRRQMIIIEAVRPTPNNRTSKKK